MINIAFLIDNTYAEQLAVTIISILKNDTQNSDFCFYILNSDLSDCNKKKIEKLKKFKDFQIKYIAINIDFFKKFPNTEYTKHLKILNYARILLPDLISENKILFLDCDLLVLDNLSEFYEKDLTNKYTCVVKERLLASSMPVKKQLKVLNIKSYFNAGVMLLNLEKMRNDNITQKALKFIEKEPEKLLLLDECTLNYCFKDDVEYVEKKYNFQYKLGYSQKDYANLINKNKKPVILHFVGPEKPYYGYKHPFENLYYKYLKCTPYKKNYVLFKLLMFKFSLTRKLKKIIRVIKILRLV